MEKEDVNSVGFQPPQTRFHGLAGGRAVEMRRATFNAGGASELAGNENFVSPRTKTFAKDFLRASVVLRSSVKRRGVEKIDSGIQSRVSSSMRVGRAHIAIRGGGKGPGAEGDLAAGKAGASERSIIHEGF